MDKRQENNKKESTLYVTNYTNGSLSHQTDTGYSKNLLTGKIESTHSHVYKADKDGNIIYELSRHYFPTGSTNISSEENIYLPDGRPDSTTSWEEGFGKERHISMANKWTYDELTDTRISYTEDEGKVDKMVYKMIIAYFPDRTIRAVFYYDHTDSPESVDIFMYSDQKVEPHYDNRKPFDEFPERKTSFITFWNKDNNGNYLQCATHKKR